MAAISKIIKFEGDNSTFVWEPPCEDFNTTTQLIVTKFSKTQSPEAAEELLQLIGQRNRKC